jgi:hypothetical protein
MRGKLNNITGNTAAHDSRDHVATFTISSGLFTLAIFAAIFFFWWM